MPFNTIYPYRKESSQNLSQKRENMPKKTKIGKWKMNFLIFSKTINMSHGTKNIFFIISELLPKPNQISEGLWFSHASLKLLFQNKWDFLGIFAPLWHKGERRNEKEEYTLKSQKGQRSIISLNHGKFLSLLKVIKQKRK